MRTVAVSITFTLDEFAVSQATEHIKAAINRSCKKSRNTSRWETPASFRGEAVGRAEWTKSTDPEFQAEDFLKIISPLHRSEN